MRLVKRELQKASWNAVWALKLGAHRYRGSGNRIEFCNSVVNSAWASGPIADIIAWPSIQMNEQNEESCASTSRTPVGSGAAAKDVLQNERAQNGRWRYAMTYRVLNLDSITRGFGRARLAYKTRSRTGREVARELSACPTRFTLAFIHSIRLSIHSEPTISLTDRCRSGTADSSE